MLAHLYIKNYALIDEINITFDKGLTTITGETGAGKSVLLGGLALILGQRADLGVLKNAEEKCIVEATFDITKHRMKSFFSDIDLDYNLQTIIRREILPSGKSRAFINDTPANLSLLSQLGKKLIDIHSQYQTQQIADTEFQFQIIDALAKNTPILNDYSTAYQSYKKAKQKLQKLTEDFENNKKSFDYDSFCLEELEVLNLKSGLQKELETQQNSLANIEDISEKIGFALHALSDEKVGIIPTLSDVKVALSKLSEFGKPYEDIYARIESSLIDLEDVFQETESSIENLETDPLVLEKVNSQLQSLYDLQKKHHVSDEDKLILLRDQLKEKVSRVEFANEDIAKQTTTVDTLKQNLKNIADTIHEKRQKTIPVLVSQLERFLKALGMSDAKFNVELTQANTFFENGINELNVLFSANKGSNFGSIKKIASGGERSRIMLSIKAILSKYIQLPSIVFDEIDTGVSGEVSLKIAAIMEHMSKSMQVICITHLPQIAAKGKTHFKVFKKIHGDSTSTNIKTLNNDERISEIAEMLGGKMLSKSAFQHAKELLED